MQLFSADATIFLKKKSYENVKKLPSKNAHNWPPFFFSVLPTVPKPAQISICAIKIAHRGTYV